jgi:hypothetical protein
VPLSLSNRAATCARDHKQSPRPTAANGQRICRARGQQPFILEPLQGRVDRTDRVLAPSAFREVSSHGKAVRLLIETSDGKQRGELERSK